MRKYIATSERHRSDEIKNVFHLHNTELKAGDSFIFDGLTWYVDEVGEIE